VIFGDLAAGLIMRRICRPKNIPAAGYVCSGDKKF
jgi:hypothetical protein